MGVADPEENSWLNSGSQKLTESNLFDNEIQCICINNTS